MSPWQRQFRLARKWPRDHRAVRVLFFDYAFLFLFLPLVAVVHHGLPPRWRNRWLLLGSVVFYAASSLIFLPVLAASITVDYMAGRRIDGASSPARRRAWLAASLVVNLGLLAYFKYAGWLTGTLRDLGLAVPLLAVPLPAGISFYTFQSMSYTIDVYRRQVRPLRSFSDFAAFVTLFPQLIAGPIVRYAHIQHELMDRAPTSSRTASGLLLLIAGLAKKLLVADTLAAASEPIFSGGTPGFAAAWVSMLLYAGQIYFDFSGYSDIAIGLGRLLGFEFPRNFDSPYQATGFSDFWRRWHITLSTWLRDYLYVPLGGNRHGTARTCLHLMVTMLLGGLWHGASWTFVLWGGLHGTFLVAERLAGERSPLRRLPLSGQRVVVFLLVTLAWVPFKLPDLAGVGRWWGAMLLGRGGPGTVEPAALAAVAGLLVLIWGPRNTGQWRPRFRGVEVAGAAALLLVTLFVGYGRLKAAPFLYFRF
jgi:alginate O-acetyltransferase complex protein AlgI